MRFSWLVIFTKQTVELSYRRVLIEIKEINMCHVKVTLLPPMSFIILHITAESVMFVQSEKQKGLVI